MTVLILNQKHAYFFDTISFSIPTNGASIAAHQHNNAPFEEKSRVVNLGYYETKSLLLK